MNKEGTSASADPLEKAAPAPKPVTPPRDDSSDSDSQKTTSDDEMQHNVDKNVSESEHPQSAQQDPAVPNEQSSGPAAASYNENYSVEIPASASPGNAAHVSGVMAASGSAAVGEHWEYHNAEHVFQYRC